MTNDDSYATKETSRASSASLELARTHAREMLRDVREADYESASYHEHFLEQQFQYLTMGDVDGIDDSRNGISRPLNVKVGKKETQPKKWRKGKKQTRMRPRREEVWCKSAQKPDDIKVPARREDETRRIAEITEEDIFLLPEGIENVQDAVKRAMLKHVGNKAKEMLPNVIHQITRVSFTINLMMNQKTWFNTMQVFYIYASPMMSHPVMTQVMSFLREVLGELFLEPQSKLLNEDDSDEEPEESPGAVEWLIFMKNLRSNWSTAKLHPLFTNFTKFFSVLCYVGVVKIDKDSWSNEVADAVMPDANRICKNSANLLEAMLDITEYIAQAAAIYIETGDLTQAVADKDNGGLPFELARITNNHNKFVLGLLGQGEEPMTDDQHHSDVVDMMTRLQRLMKNTKNQAAQSLYSRELVSVSKMRTEVYSALERSPSRIQPMGLYFVGPPGAGKSTLMSIVAEALLRSYFGEYDARKSYDYASSDAFWSKFKADCLVINFNDVGASKDDNTRLREYEDMLRVTDIARWYPPMPEAHEKGMVDVNNVITMCSGNNLFPQLGAYVNDTGAFSRRYKLCPYVVPKAKFCQKDSAGNTFLDSSLVTLARERGELTGNFDEVVDIYLFESRPTKLGVEPVPIQIGGKHKFGVEDFIAILVPEFKRHLDAQKRKVATFETRTLINFDPVASYEKHYANAPIESMSLSDPSRFLNNSPVMELMNESEQRGNMSDASSSRRQRERPKGKRGRKHHGVPFELSEEDQKILDMIEEQEMFDDNLDKNIPEADFIRKHIMPKKHISDIDPTNLIELGVQHDAFHRRWSWVPKVPLKREWAPDWIWHQITPQKRTHINKALNQNLSLLGIGVTTVAFGPMSVFAPLGLCAVSWAMTLSAGSVFMVSAAKNLHTTSLTRNERVFLMANWRQVNVARIAGFSALLILACQFFRSMQKSKKEFVAEGEEFQPTPMNDPFYRNLGHNPWNRHADVLDHTHLSEAAKTTVSEDLCPLVKRATYAGEIYYGDDDTLVGSLVGFAFHAGYMLITEHYLTQMRKYAKDNNLTNVEFKLILRCGPPKHGHQFAHTLDLNNYYKVEDADMAVLLVNELGDRKNLIKHFPVKRASVAVSAFSITRKPRADAEMVTVQTDVHRKVYVAGVGSYIGFNYTRHEHYSGLCGSPVVSSGAKSHIQGFHSAGSSLKKNVCVATIVTQGDLEKAMAHYQQKVPNAQVVVPESALNLSTRVEGFQRQEPHYKSAIRYVSDDAQFTVFGTSTKRSTFSSRAIPNVIAPSVGVHCGIDPNIYRPPVSSPSWFGPQTNADAIAISARNFPQSALTWAYKDYMDGVEKLIERSTHKMYPLSDFEVINGTGRMYEDAMNRNSVWGEPFSGAKKKGMFENHEEDYKPFPTYTGPIWDVNQEYKDLISEVETEYKKGAPVHPVFTSCIKDEVHLKPKARGFEIAPMPITWIGRKLTLTTSSFLRLGTTITECAVGSNCHGPDGSFLFDIFVKFGSDRIIAGDFSKYDKRMPVSILKAALNVYKDIAINAWPENEEKDDYLRMYDALTHDITYPTLNYFGDMLQMNTGNFPSGVPITADLNGIGNSLIHRCVYYLAYQEKFGTVENIPAFREMVSLVTYGDDSAGSVHKDCSWFDMKKMSIICKKYGIVYTDPEKSLETPKFYPLEDLDFLKRNFNKVHECGFHVGALKPQSIYKPLCMVLWDPTHHFNKHELAAETVKSSVLEAFNHGREFYEEHRARMICVTKENDIYEVCHELLAKTFDDRLAQWHKDYKDQVEYLVSIGMH